MNTARLTTILLSRFRRNLRAARIASDLTQTDLARKLGVAPSYLCDLEAGRRSPNLATLAPLAAALGIGVEKLVQPRRRKVVLQPRGRNSVHYMKYRTPQLENKPCEPRDR